MSDQKLLADGTLIIPTNVDVKDVGRVILDQKGTKFCNIFYRDAGEIIYCDSCKQMDDSIGRTAAIDAVNKIAPVNTEYDCTLLDILDVRYVLTELPSAEPKTPSNGSITRINPENTHDRTMGDLIRRQEAKDAIDMALDHIDHVPPWVYDKLLNVLNEVPSAEKAQLSGEDATKDATSGLIRRQDAIDALGKEPKFKIKMVKTYAEGRSDQWFKDVATIASLPSVEPTIIRCRDCKHHDGIRCFRWNSTIITGFDDFCSNAEKRGEEDE